MGLDRQDKRILATLQQDGSVTNLELAEKIGLSPSPCARRVKQLEEAGFINKKVALLNANKLNLKLTALIQISMDKHTPDRFELFENLQVFLSDPMPPADACLDLRCKIRSYLSPNFSAIFTDFRQLVRAISRLYRSRFLQPNTHFAAFFEIYKNSIPLHRSKFNILANFRRKVLAIFKFSSKSLFFFTIFIEFCTDFDKNLLEFRQILYSALRISPISGFLTIFSIFSFHVSFLPSERR